MIDLSARRPTRFISSPCPAIPMTRLPKMIGTTTDLIILRKTVESGLRLVPRSGFSHPIRAPMTMKTRIHLVSEIPRRDRHNHFIGWPGCPLWLRYRSGRSCPAVLLPDQALQLTPGQEIADDIGTHRCSSGLPFAELRERSRRT